jgi:hypothetical protein
MRLDKAAYPSLTVRPSSEIVAPAVQKPLSPDRWDCQPTATRPLAAGGSASPGQPLG